MKSEKQEEVYTCLRFFAPFFYSKTRNARARACAWTVFSCADVIARQTFQGSPASEASTLLPPTFLSLLLRSPYADVPVEFTTRAAPWDPLIFEKQRRLTTETRDCVTNLFITVFIGSRHPYLQPLLLHGRYRFDNFARSQDASLQTSHAGHGPAARLGGGHFPRNRCRRRRREVDEEAQAEREGRIAEGRCRRGRRMLPSYS